MFTKAKRKYFGPERFEPGNLKVGEEFSVDSGLGGSHTLKFDRFIGRRLVFIKRATPDTPQMEYRLAHPEHAARHLFVLVPENDAFAPPYRCHCSYPNGPHTLECLNANPQANPPTVLA